MNNEIQILIGVPGSGKTTYAEQLLKQDKSYVKVSRDDFRHMLRNEWYPGEEVENTVTEMCDLAIKVALKKGWNIVLDNTHCTSKTLKDTIRAYGKEARLLLKVIGAELSVKEIKHRNAQRDKAVPEQVIDRMYKGFTNIVKNKKDFQELINEVAGSTLVPTSTFKQNPRLPKAILVDIDGTIAHMNGKRGPFDWHKVDRDDPDEAILNLIRGLIMDYHIVFLSGRDSSARELTIEWLRAYYATKAPIELYMRPEGDFRKDNIVKRELFDKYIAPKYYVEAVFDDRDQVVRMWREMGLKCLQVDYGNF